MTVGRSFTERRDAERVDKRCHSPTVGTRESVAATHLAAWRHRRGKGPRARRWNGRPAALEEQDRCNGIANGSGSGEVAGRSAGGDVFSRFHAEEGTAERVKHANLVSITLFLTWTKAILRNSFK